MSATEIITEIRRLAPEDQKKVLVFLQDLQGESGKNGGGINYVKDADFDKTADKVLNERADLFRRLAK